MAFIRNKWPILLILCAVTVGALYVAPQALIWRKLNDLNKSYLVVQLTDHGDEAFGTVSRAREIYDGRFPPGDLYLDENAPTPFGPFPIPLIIFSGFLYLSGGDMNTAYVSAHFVIPIILFLIFYAFSWLIIRSRAWSLTVAFLCTLTPIFNHLPAAFASVREFLNIAAKNFYPGIQTPLPDLFLGRIEDPMLTFLIFVPAIMALWWFWRAPSPKRGIVAGAALAALYYTYFHYWTYMTVVAGLLMLYALVNVKKDPRRAKSSLLLTLTTAVLTIPYWINYFQLRNLPGVDEYIGRVGIVTGRYFHFIKPFPIVFDYAVYLALAALVYWLFYRKLRDTRSAIFYWISLAAAVIVWNVQLVLGYTVHPDHWIRPISAIIFLIILHSVFTLSQIYKWNQRRLIAIFILAIALLLTKKTINAAIFINPPQEILNKYTFNSNLIDAFRWINRNLPGEPKIISPSFVTELYLKNETSARPYLVGGMTSSASNSLIEERFLIAYKLFGVASEKIALSFEYDLDKICARYDCAGGEHHAVSNLSDQSSYMYLSYYKYFPGRPVQERYRYITEEKAAELLDRYRGLWVGWNDVDAEYVFWGPWEKALSKFNPAEVSVLELVYKNDSVEIHRIKND